METEFTRMNTENMKALLEYKDKKSAGQEKRDLFATELPCKQIAM